MNEVLNKCALCEIDLVQVNLKGASIPWKDFPNVMVAKDLFVWGCPICGEKIMKGSEISILDDILKSTIKEETSILLAEIKKKFGMNQKRLSINIGISEVYLSNLIGKKTIPSFEKFNYLRLLNQAPKHLIEEVVIGQTDCSARGKNIVDLNKFRHLNMRDKDKFSSGSKFYGILDCRKV